MIETVRAAVLGMKLKKIEGIVQEALAAGADPGEVLDSMSDAMSEIGARFERNEIFVPEMLVSAKTMQKGVAVLKPLLGGDGASRYGTFVIGTVSGDLHDIGKNLVAMMLESAGFAVVDLGTDVSAAKFVEAIQANPDCRVVGLSALLTTTMAAMRETVQAIGDAGLRDRVKIMVGGAPISQEFCDEIGADAYTDDAASAARVAVELLG